MDNQVNVPIKPKKKKSQPATWRRNVAKRLKSQGESYVQNHSMNLVPPKAQEDLTCRHGCSNLLSEEEKRQVFNRFYRLKDHDMQNQYLRGCIGENQQQTNWKINIHDRIVSVCLKYFLGLHDIKYSRLRTKVLNTYAVIDDLRGKHGHHKKTNDAVLESVRTFLRELQPRESHYSISTNPNRKYIDSNSTMKSLYEKLCNDENNIVTTENFSLWLFRRMFNFEFNIQIGYPRSGVCDTCETINCNIKYSHINNDLERENHWKAQQRQHLEEAGKFFDQMSKDRVEFKDPSHGFYCFDFQKNLPFPVTNISKEFYLRQLWMFNFTIHDLKTGEAYMHLYCENFAKKGCAETISFVKNFVETIITPEITHLHWFQDNSFGQNKNRYLLAYFQTLTLGRFNSVEISFPLPGHSRMQVDADFALIEKRKRRQDRILFPSEWVEIIRNTRKEKPFHILFANHAITDNLERDTTPIVQVRDFKTAVTPLISPAHGLNQIRRLLFRKGINNPVVSRNINDEPTEAYQITKYGVTGQVILESLDAAQPAYDGHLLISKEKFENIQYLLTKFYRSPEKTFYESVRGPPEEHNNHANIIRDIMMEYGEFDISFLE